jgi:hypothetical protein
MYVASNVDLYCFEGSKKRKPEKDGTEIKHDNNKRNILIRDED